LGRALHHAAAGASARLPGHGRGGAVGRRALIPALLAALLGPTAAAGPTRIERVDLLVDAPYALFGRTRAEVEARLGPPVRASSRPVVRPGVPGARAVEELEYAGLVIETSDGRVRRIRMTVSGHVLPFGVAIGTPRGQVEDILGEPQQATDTLSLYLYSDGYPDTVTFHFRDGRVHRIEWTYWVPGIAVETAP
jgi:hypothetical protein